MIKTTFAGAAIAAALAAAVPTAASAQAFTPERPECIAPASAGGGWDFTCRQVARVMRETGLIEGSMRVQNLSGGGGGVAFAEVVNKRDDENDLIVAASTATATRLAQGAYPGNTMDQVRWLGTIGADYGVIGVRPESDIKDLSQLMTALKDTPRDISIGGGSASGGWDHLKVLIAAQKAGVEDLRAIKYVAFAGGGEAISQLLAGSLQAYSGDLSEAMGFVASGDLRVLAVLAPERLEGDFSAFPTAKEQGVDVVGANWRGFYGPGKMSDEAYDWWVGQLDTMYDSQEWKAVMEQNGLAELDLHGKEFNEFVAQSVSEIETISRQIGLIQ
ncbi:tripartite tricarboxylate transporter substrate-binding protein [Acuticoccus sp. MNP-M23]|uniref:Bug family tripartite tricarboxylate transporter substrate binding protein n=1 Tax=Acuticoccus sp. MNP-M23 TaxID=3072793 RepID=UPI002814A9F7|nr:tripartite tricarboxylate transporter substrate-binding protein [Acuticoccus sp. MNP-M23]WMS41901.1 tripartite tricarboxylate transporter substrate-binding protein [Acuticoccus sp. MNP-M23]